MARYKFIDTDPRVLAVDLATQLLPGTFEHALNHLLDGAIDLSHFDARFRNDTTGAPAYPPAMLLTVVLFAYSQGIVSSRGIERACQDHAIAKVSAGVLAVCDAQGLIGREMFAIDGVKLPSNASKQRSGTRANFEKQATKLDLDAEHMRDWLTTHPRDRPGARGGTRQSNRTDNERAKMATSNGVNSRARCARR